MNNVSPFPMPMEPSYSPYNWPVITHESPETAIARQIPERLLKLLERESERRHYNEALAIGSGVVNTYLGRLSSDDTSRIERISVVPYEKIGGFFGFGGNKGMVISFRRT